MSFTQAYIQITHAIAARHYSELAKISVEKPVHFNWVTDILERHYIPLYKNNKALIWKSHDQEEIYSYGELLEISNRLLNFLQRHGVKQGDIVYVQLPVVPQNWITYIACIKGGLVLVPAAPILSVKDIEYRFLHNRPAVIISDTENCVRIDAALSSPDQPKTLKILTDGERYGWHPWLSVQKSGTDCEAAETKPDDLLFLFFTSGTTGMPKVVSHTHISYPFGHLTTAAWIGLQPGDIHFNIAQPGWAKFAWSSFFAPLSMGATVFVYQQAGKMDASLLLSVIEQYKVTTFCAPPTALRMLVLEHLAAFRFAFRECVSAGEPLNPEVIEAWKKGTGILIRDGYGQTETTLLAGNLPGEPVKFGSMGKPMFIYEMDIVDEDGKPLPIDEEGHIGVKVNGRRLNGIFKEYAGAPEKKNELVRNGFYLTGDKAYKDADGYFWFVGRDDDVIKSSDYRIGPFEVESVLLEHEAVIESAVVGSPHAIKGNLVKAFIVLRNDLEGTEALAGEIYLYCRKNLAIYKIPRILEFVRELPKTVSGKIRRVELRSAEAMNKARGIKGEQEFIFQ